MQGSSPGRGRFNGRLKLGGSKLDRPFTRDAPTSRLVGMRKEGGEDIKLITPLVLPESATHITCTGIFRFIMKNEKK